MIVEMHTVGIFQENTFLVGGKRIAAAFATEGSAGALAVEANAKTREFGTAGLELPEIADAGDRHELHGPTSHAGHPRPGGGPDRGGAKTRGSPAIANRYRERLCQQGG